MEIEIAASTSALRTPTALQLLAGDDMASGCR